MSFSVNGLSDFIKEIRNCKSIDTEQSLCYNTIAKINNKFQNSIPFQKQKKYIWKLIFISLLSYDIPFDFTTALLLITSNKYSEKKTGYFILSNYITEKSLKDFQKSKHINIFLSKMKSDLDNFNEVSSSLALVSLGNLCPESLLILFTNTLAYLAFPKKKDSLLIRKKATLSLLRLLRVNQITLETFDCSVINSFFKPELLSLGYLSSLTSFCIGICQAFGSNRFTNLTKKVLDCLERLEKKDYYPKDYLYHETQNPWLQIKLIKLLKLLNKDKNDLELCEKFLENVLIKGESIKEGSENNSKFAIFFEGVDLLAEIQNKVNKNLIFDAVGILGILIRTSQPNIK